MAWSHPPRMERTSGGSNRCTRRWTPKYIGGQWSQWIFIVNKTCCNELQWVWFHPGVNNDECKKNVPSKYYQQYQPRLSIIDLSGSFWLTEGRLQWGGKAKYVIFISEANDDLCIGSIRPSYPIGNPSRWCRVGSGALEPQPLHIVLGKLNQLLASFEVLGLSWGRRMHGDTIW